MKHPSSGLRAARKLARIGAAAIFGCGLGGAPALGQSIVFGDPGGQACYQAAAFGDYSHDALDICDAAIRSNELTRRDLAATYHNRGIIHRMRGEIDAAMADYRQSQQILPDLPEIYISEGNVSFVTGDFRGALDAYDTALSLGIDAEHVARFNRGLAYEQLGRLDAAEDEFLAAAAIAPDWGLPPIALERVRERRADRDAEARRRNGS